MPLTTQIVSRYERGDMGVDAAATRAYVQALNKLGRGDQALQYVRDGVAANRASAFTPKSTSPSHFPSEASAAPPPSTSPSRVRRSREQMMEEESDASSELLNLTTRSGTREDPIYVVSQPAEMTSKQRFWAGAKLVAALWIATALISTYSEEIQKISGAGSKKFSSFNEIDADAVKSVTFADVQGVDEAKEELVEVVEFLRDPAKYTRLGGKLPKGVLLTGPPGTGKTLLARAIAGEAGVPFFHCSGSEFDEMFVGVGAKRVRELFAAAKKKSPCIIFMDEIDAVGGKRNPRDQQFAKMTLNQLLVEMDGFNQSSGIIVIGATNFPELLDKALVRPGRFDRKVIVPIPDVKGRLDILKVHSRTVPMASDTKLNLIARGTTGLSGAELGNLINHAALRAAALGKQTVAMIDLEWAKDRVLMGAERKSAIIPEVSRKKTAYHEAGHALVNIYTEGSRPIYKATIMPRANTLGMVVQLPEGDEHNYSKKQLRAMLDIGMGGQAAEEIVNGPDNIETGASNDIENTTKIARSMLTTYGMGSPAIGKVNVQNKEDYEALSPNTRQVIEEELRQMMEEAWVRAKTILTKHRHELDLLANALMEYESLSGEEIKIIISGNKLKRSPLPDETGDKPK